MLIRFFRYYRKNQVLAQFSTFRTFRLYLTLLAILVTRVTNTRNTGNSNPKILAVRTPEGLITVARRCDRSLAHHYNHRQADHLRITPSTTPGITPARESAESTEFGVQFQVVLVVHPLQPSRVFWSIINIKKIKKIKLFKIT